MERHRLEKRGILASRPQADRMVPLVNSRASRYRHEIMDYLNFLMEFYNQINDDPNYVAKIAVTNQPVVAAVSIHFRKWSAVTPICDMLLLTDGIIVVDNERIDLADPDCLEKARNRIKNRIERHKNIMDAAMKVAREPCLRNIISM